MLKLGGAKSMTEARAFNWISLSVEEMSNDSTEIRSENGGNDLFLPGSGKPGIRGTEKTRV